MAKINLSALPVQAPKVVGPLEFDVLDQGKFVFWMREPNLPMILQASTLKDELVATLCANGPARYPWSEALLMVTPKLCETVAMVATYLCDEKGRPLQAGEAYEPDDLFKMSVLLPEVFASLGVKAYQSTDETAADPGNDSGTSADS